MTKYDRNFCKPDKDMRPLYCPLPLAVVIHHHDEWDEPVIDLETGEPTGETEHRVRDWDEHRTEVFPTAADKALMGYLPLSSVAPVDPPKGKHYESTDKIERDGDGYKWVYALVDNPPPPPRRWTKLAIETAFAQADMLDATDAFLAQTTIVGKLTAARAFSRCDYIEEGYPTAEQWDAMLNSAAQTLGTTRAEIDAFLDAIPTEGGM